MPGMMRCNNNFAPVVRRFRGNPREISLTSMRIALRAAQREAVKEARLQLKNLVYAAPLPASVGDGAAFGWTPATYLSVRRIGRVWNAVKASPLVNVETGAAMAEVKVDKGDFDTYYYAWILNKGGMGGRYSPRPFWTIMVKTMRVRLREVGMLGPRAAKAFLLGDDTYGGLLATGVDESDTFGGSGF